MRIRITIRIYFPSGSMLNMRTDECEYYHYYSGATAYHAIALYDQTFTESYPKGNFEMRFDSFRKTFQNAQALMYVKCALQCGLSESEIKSFKGSATFEMAPVTYQFLVCERRDDGKIIKGAFEITEDNGYIATVFIYPDNPDWAVPAANKKFGNRQDANGYVLNNILNHNWFDYYRPLEQGVNHD